ncbi:hypothetical protein M0804_015562 [Polistes exclamans]|nr:hypothetical protein M0804_015562 [Polistes exclamans]
MDTTQKANASKNANSVPNTLQGAASTLNNTDDVHQLQECPRSFAAKRGLGVHVRKGHLEVANAAISVEREKKRLLPEELRLLARVEAQGVLSKGVRRRADYKNLVAAAIHELRAVKSPDDVSSGSRNASAPLSQGLSENRSRLPGEPLRNENTQERPRNEIKLEIEQLISKIDEAAGFNTEILKRIARQLINGVDVAGSVNAWLQSVFPPASRQSGVGIDGVSARQWRNVPVMIRTLFYNIIMARGGFQTEMLASRTIFLPKKHEAKTAADFRPISIASVVVRQMHKILAVRLRSADLIDVRQRSLEDGCTENISVLASFLDDAKRRLGELHIVSMDCAKAFDSVSQEAITAVLREKVGGSRSEPMHVGRGVRQGDPLLSLFFCLVLDKVIRPLISDVRYDLGGTCINTLLYADGTILVASTIQGMGVLVKTIEERAEGVGLEINTSKFSALLVVPSGKSKSSKVLTKPQFQLKSAKFA